MSPSATTEIDALQTWFSSTNRVQVRYPAPLFERIDAEVSEAFSALPRGGLEVGGVFFGTHDANVVTLAAFRPIQCEHRFGPTFELSDSDEAALGELLTRYAEADADLAHLEPVGWFHSHTRSDLALTEQDAYLHNRYFAKPWQVALIVKPEQLRATQATFYVPDDTGTLRPAAAEEVFEISRSRHRPAEVLEDDSEVAQTALTIIPTPLVRHGAARPGATQPRQPSYRRIIAVCALLAGMLSAGLYTMLTDRSTPPDIGLRISGSGEQLQVVWNPPRGAHSADLEIRDGAAEPQFVHLSAQQLAGGSLTYVRRAPEVSIRMRVYGATPAPADFVASYLGPAIRKADVSPPSAMAEQAPAMPAPDPQPAVEPPKLNVQPPARLSAETGQRARGLELPPVTRLPDRPAVTPPPVLAVTPDLASAPANLSPIAPKPWTEAPAARRRAPASGRAIWTGTLAPGATVTFEAGRASAGNLNGRLPQQPAHITAHVADLTPAGIVIYTRDAAHRARVGTSESPGVRNGWNLTTWRWDDKRGADVRVVETPGPQNEWKRLTVRGEGRKVSMLILDWEELPAPPAK